MIRRRFLIIISINILAFGCGTRDDTTRDQTSQTPPTAPQAIKSTVEPTKMVQPIQSTNTDTPATEDIKVLSTAANPNMLIGTFEQEDNRAVKVTIGKNLRVATNITIPITPTNGSRLTPLLPQRLKEDASGLFYFTDGTFNRPGGEVDNMSFRVDGYDEGTRLDVTLVVQVRPSDVITYLNLTQNTNSAELLFCLPLPKPNPPPLPPCENNNKCCCCKCNNDCSKDCDGFEPTKSMLFVYHFIRV